MGWWRRLLGDPGGDGVTGRPRSANGASSFHLVWDVTAGRWVAAEAVLEVVTPPAVPALYFWALQVSFSDAGRAVGGAHLGLQWHPSHPGSTAVNWGGYEAGGGELSGTESELPSATGNPNTRDFAWRVGVPYRLTVSSDGAAADSPITRWRGAVTDLDTGVTTVVRALSTRGSTIGSPMVWSEVFADCDAPTSVVRWSDLRVVDADGQATPVSAVRANYQTRADGGCTNTDSMVADDGFVQQTSSPRRTPSGRRLALP